MICKATETLKTNMVIACVSAMQAKPKIKLRPRFVCKDDSSGIHPRTFIMRWNPEISSHKIVDFEESMENFFERDFYYEWSVFDYQKVRVGDRFFMIKVGNGNTGVVMEGTIISYPFKDEDWSGKGRDVRYVRMSPNCMVRQDNESDLLTTKALHEAIPGIDWNHGHSGVLLDDNKAKMLDALWEEHLKATIEHQKYDF
jgi:hypothetical protein